MNNTRPPKAKPDRFFLAYYEVQVMGATLYLHVIIKAKDGKEAGEKFFSQPTRRFGDVALNPKGTVGGSVGLKRIPEKWARMLQEPGGPIDLSKLKAPKPPRIRTRPVRSIAAIQAIEAGKASGIDYPAGTTFPKEAA